MDFSEKDANIFWRLEPKFLTIVSMQWKRSTSVTSMPNRLIHNFYSCLPSRNTFLLRLIIFWWYPAVEAPSFLELPEQCYPVIVSSSSQRSDVNGGCSENEFQKTLRHCLFLHMHRVFLLFMVIIICAIHDKV